MRCSSNFSNLLKLPNESLNEKIGYPLVRNLKRHPCHKLVLVVCTVVFTVLMVSAGLRAGSHSSASKPKALPEYLIKAAMLYHFARFSKWPKSSFKDSDTPMRFCVIGQDPFGPDLDSLVKYPIRGRDILTLRLNNVKHAGSCHLLFIARSESGRLSSILKALRRRPVLTVGDMPNFAARGGIIYLKHIGSHVRFEINTGYARLIGLSFRSELLMLADIISGKINRSRFRAPNY